MITVRTLRKALDLLGNEDAEIFIEISGVKFPMCGKIDKAFITFSYKDEPDKDRMQEALVFIPCECKSDDEDKKKGDEFFLN